jgi:nucleotide-binding universal stress UspA family protein
VRVVVGIDGSTGGEAALRFGVEEATQRGLPLRVVCAWEASGGAFVGEAFAATADAFTEAERNADDVLRAALEQIGPKPAVEVEALSVEGHAPTVLVEQAQDAVLIVVGTRGHGTTAGLLLGSVSKAVVHHAPCAVAIVPA